MPTTKTTGKKKRFRNLPLTLIALPGIIYLVINNYIPMFGVFLAFKDYSLVKGIFGSDWSGFANFEFLFRTDDAWIMTRNTLLYNFVFIVLGTVLAIAVAIILNGRLAAKGGDLAIGAYGIINSYGILFVMFVIGLCQGMQPIVGYNYGARKIDRAKKAFFLAIKVGTAITTFGFLLIELFPKTAATVFTTDATLVGITVEGLRYVFLLFPFVGFQIVTSNFFQSLGKVHLSIFLSLTRQVIFLIPALYICSALFDLKGVWIATPVADFLAIVVTFVILKLQMKKLK